MSEAASRADIALLFGRAAFGATSADLGQWAGQPYAAAVDHLLDVPSPATRAPLADDADRLVVQALRNPQQAQYWWLERMRTTPYPLEERLVLFWHDHFATAITNEVTATDVMVQNQTLRLHALGNFREMAYALTIDPAMLKWLDGNVNVNRQPNENYARELLELFTLGVIPQIYTEQDIQEAARALTGWIVNGVGAAEFRPNNHDTGTKSILGVTIEDAGAEEYKLVVDAALDQQLQPGMATKFLAYKLVQNFAYDPTSRNLFTTPDALIDEVAATLAATDYDIREAVRTLLNSTGFRVPDEAASTQHVRQPLEAIVHGAKVLDQTLRSDNRVRTTLDHAGQLPFMPPNVGGWPVGEAWLSPTTIRARYDGLHWLTRLHESRQLVHPMPPSADIETGGAEWARFLGMAGFEPTTLAALQSYLSSVDVPENQRQDGLYVLAAMSPEWQVM